MDDARRILDTRLARGEITIDEHKHLVASLASPEQTQPQPSPLSNLSRTPPWKWGVGVAGLCVVLFLAIRPETPGAGLSVGNIDAAGDYVSATLANTTTKSGDAVLFIKQDGKTYCEKIIYVSASKRYNLRFACEPLSVGDFQLGVAWADRSPAMAAIATRIKTD